MLMPVQGSNVVGSQAVGLERQSRPHSPGNQAGNQTGNQKYAFAAVAGAGAGARVGKQAGNQKYTFERAAPTAADPKKKSVARCPGMLKQPC